MQWTGCPNGGFSTAPAEQLIHPVIADGPFGYPSVNVAAQKRDVGSLLAWSERVIRARECREFGRGECEFLDPGRPEALAHRCTRGESPVIALHNLSNAPQQVSVRLRARTAARDVLTREAADATASCA